MRWLLWSLLCGLGLPVAIVDLRTRRIPNAWMTVGALLMLVLQSLTGHLGAALLGGGLAVGLAGFARGVTHGLGLGDVKYFGVVGLALGPIGGLLVLGGAALGAAGETLVRSLRHPSAWRQARPLGPWIAVMSVLVASGAWWHR